MSALIRNCDSILSIFLSDSFFFILQLLKEYNDDTSVNMEITLSEENMMVARQEGFLKTFKLTTTIGTTNMHLFDEHGVIKKYATPEQSKQRSHNISHSVFFFPSPQVILNFTSHHLAVLEEFFNLRLQYYEKRKVREKIFNF